MVMHAALRVYKVFWTTYDKSFKPNDKIHLSSLYFSTMTPSFLFWCTDMQGDFDCYSGAIKNDA